MRSSEEVSALQAETEAETKRVRKAAEDVRLVAEEVRLVAEGAESVAVRSSQEVAALREIAASGGPGVDLEELRSLAAEVEALQTAIDRASEDTNTKLDETAIRLRAEASSSSDKLQANLAAQVNSMRAELMESQGNDRDEMAADETVDDEQAIAQRREMADLHRQIRDLQSQIVAVSNRSAAATVASPEGEAPTKRWVAHLERPSVPVFATPELSAVEESSDND